LKYLKLPEGSRDQLHILGIEALINLKHLDLTRCHTVKDIDLIALTTLETLCLDGNVNITGWAISRLPRLTALNISLYGRNIMEHDWLPIAHQLNCLWARESGHNGIGTEILKQMTNLRCLYIGNTAPKNAIPYMTKLEQLILADVCPLNIQTPDSLTRLDLMMSPMSRAYFPDRAIAFEKPMLVNTYGFGQHEILVSGVVFRGCKLVHHEVQHEGVRRPGNSPFDLQPCEWSAWNPAHLPFFSSK
jgi:hypothetical protein